MFTKTVTTALQTKVWSVNFFSAEKKLDYSAFSSELS